MMQLFNFRRKKRLNHGVSTIELALLTPILMILFLGIVQLIIYIQGSTATQYAAFAAARAFQVYGDRKLKDIGYKRVRELPFTNQGQTIAEAAAEKIIFESLLWEHKRITVEGNELSLDRYYQDGIHHQYNGVSSVTNEGAVQVNLLGCPGVNNCTLGLGVEVTYCLPIVFPGLDVLFGSSKKNWPCKGRRLGQDYSGIAVIHTAKLGREPTEL